MFTNKKNISFSKKTPIVEATNFIKQTMKFGLEVHKITYFAILRNSSDRGDGAQNTFELDI